MDELQRILPTFTEDGLLPPSDYELSLAELIESPLVMAPTPGEQYANWDESWRRKLVENLSVMVHQLWKVGVTEIFVNGSFAEDKDHPNDIDGYFECELMRLTSGELERDLDLLDPHKVWTWDPTSRRPYRGYPKSQLPIWHAYRVELYPHCGQLSGIRDPHGHELEFPSAFRQSRAGSIPKGIVKIKHEVTS